MSAEHTQRGKWSLAGVPHRGWFCVYVEDVEDELITCEMCESSEVRYIHYMRHPEYPEEFRVGCICAEHMEGDYVGPQLRERKLKNTAKRRLSWAKRQWRVSAKGNTYLNAEGFNIVVYDRTDWQGKYWCFRVVNRETGKEAYSRRRYVTEADAKLSSLGGLIWAKEHLT